MKVHGFSLLCVLCASGVDTAFSNPPEASYLFPAGGRRGTTVSVRVGGLFLHDGCGFELDGPGLSATPVFKPTKRIGFEGPLLPMPESQQSEDYPADVVGRVAISPTAPLGATRARLWTSQGAATGPAFVVGDFPEVMEREVAGDPIPQFVSLPVTANGRIFPRENLDLWAFRAAKGQSITALAVAARIRSPLVPRLEILDVRGTVLAENGPHAVPGTDASVRFTAPADGEYRVRIGDARMLGGPAYVYRLTLTAGPVIERAFPLGGRRGEPLALQVFGQATDAKPVTLHLPVAGPREWHPDLASHEPVWSAVALDLDDLPEYRADRGANPIPVPAILNGTVAGPGTGTGWPLALGKGKKVEFELRARKLGSPLCGVISVHDAAGNELARAEPADAAADPTLSFTPPADGTYSVRVTERFRGRGGPTFAYRLRAVESSSIRPDFQMKLVSEAISLPRGATAKVRVVVARTGGMNEPIELTVEGLPAGVAAAKVEVNPGQAAADLSLTAGPTARVRHTDVRIVGTAKATGRQRAAVVPGPLGVPDSNRVLLGVAMPAPFALDADYVLSTAPRGQVYRRTYKILRNGYTGPLEVRLADKQIRHLQGVTGPVLVVPPGQNEFEYPALLPPWIEIGRTCRVCIVAVGKVKDEDGVEHTVSYSSMEQNMQMIVVPEPGRLGLTLDTTGVRADPGATVRIPFRVDRASGLTGDVSVEALLPTHWKGVTVRPAVVPAGESAGELIVAFSPGGCGPFNLPATVRATLTRRGDPVVAESALEFLDGK